jgi:hypothetical protein
MIPLSIRDMQILIAAAVFLFGIAFVILGTYILLTRGYSKEVSALASQTAKLGQKGLAEDVSTLVTSASELVLSINQLIRTASGIGVFLIALGLLMLAMAYWIVMQVQPSILPQP